MNKNSTEKWLTIFNYTVVFYFAVIYALYYYQIEFVLIGVIREMLTLPLMITQLVLLFLGIGFLARGKRQSLLFVASLVVLFICSALTIGSFFF